MEVFALLSSLLIALPVIAIILMMVAVVLQWAYKLVCKRNLRYKKAYALILVLFVINLGLSFLVGAITVSMSADIQENLDLIKLPILFVVGAAVYGRWMNSKRGTPIGFVKGLMVQGLFYAMMFGFGLLISIPFVLLMEEFGG